MPQVVKSGCRAMSLPQVWIRCLRLQIARGLLAPSHENAKAAASAASLRQSSAWSDETNCNQNQQQSSSSSSPPPPSPSLLPIYPSPINPRIESWIPSLLDRPILIMPGLTSATGVLGFLSDTEPELKVFALQTLNDDIDTIWTEVAGSVGQM